MCGTRLSCDAGQWQWAASPGRMRGHDILPCTMLPAFSGYCVKCVLHSIVSTKCPSMFPAPGEMRKVITLELKLKVIAQL